MDTTMSEPVLLLLNKPSGQTSYDCIRHLKKFLNRTDLGHGGTLDRFAKGVLPIFFGEGLKLVRFFLDHYPTLPTFWKKYKGTISLGVATDTGDPEGTETEKRTVPNLTQEHIQSAMQFFVEEVYEQTPPNFSAKKIAGQRASTLARQGKKIDLKPTMITIKDFCCHCWDQSSIKFEATCSKGAYMRVLANDLAKKLDTVGHLSELTRIGVGLWELSQTFTLEEIEHKGMECALTLEEATSFLPKFPLLFSEVDLLKIGKVDGLLARLSNSGLSHNAYCAVYQNIPMALLELLPSKKSLFLRAFG